MTSCPYPARPRCCADKWRVATARTATKRLLAISDGKERRIREVSEFIDPTSARGVFTRHVGVAWLSLVVDLSAGAGIDERFAPSKHLCGIVVDELCVSGVRAGLHGCCAAKTEVVGRCRGTSLMIGTAEEELKLVGQVAIILDGL